MQSPFSTWKWSNRLVVLFTYYPDDADFQKQVSNLTGHAPALDERDVRIITVDKDRFSIHGPDMETYNAFKYVGTPQGMRDYLDAPMDEFALYLLGKDGEIKLRSDKPVSVAEINSLIDSMPMRHRELSRK